MKKELKNAEERLIGLDILRILSMVLITFRHFIGYAGLTETLSLVSVNGLLIRSLDVVCGSAVNIFVLISGFFLINSDFKWKRVLKIWGETLFYSVICFAIAVVFGLEKITVGKILLSFAPLLTRHYWFTVAYLALYVVSPFINKMLHTLTEKEYTIFVVGGAILLSGWTSVVYFSEGVLTGGNTGLLWFVYLYILGGYIQLYRHRLPGVGVCVAGFAVVMVVLLAYSYLSKLIGFLKNFDLLNDDSILELLLSVFLFVSFLRIKIKSSWLRRLIVFVGSCSFGVYLIQESCMIREWLWYGLVKPDQFSERWYLIFVGIIVVVLLFFAAVLGHRVFEVLFGLIEKLFSKNKKL